MHPSRLVHAAVAASVVAVLGMGDARAGTITSVTTSSLPGVSTGTIGPIGATPAPNNDNATAASPNVIPYSIFFNTLGPLAVEFATSDSAGTTEYRVSQSFINNTGQAWTGFVFELGYGVGDAFTPSGAADGLDFDTPDADPAPAAASFAVLSLQSDRIAWSGGSVPSVGGVTFSFAIDVPDGLVGGRFTLLQTPIVATPIPEPSSALLLGLGMMGLALRLRRAGAA